MLAALTVAAASYSAVANFPCGPILAVLLIGAAIAAWYGLLRRGVPRVAGLGVAVVLALAAVLIVIFDSGVLELVLIGTGALATVVASKAAFAVRVPLPGAPDPARPVLFFNPKSGGGKAERFKLADEARARGIKPIELTPHSALEQLARDAVADGADALAMAGGDGSQAIVAAVAAEQGLPYAASRPARATTSRSTSASIATTSSAPSTRSWRRRDAIVDLADVNGRVFVNNVSLGLYAAAVQRRATATRS